MIKQPQLAAALAMAADVPLDGGRRQLPPWRPEGGWHVRLHSTKSFETLAQARSRKKAERQRKKKGRNEKK